MTRAIALAAVVAMLATTGSVTMAADPSPPPSTTAAAGMCPAGHVVATTPVPPGDTPSPDATVAPLLKGSPPSDRVPKHPMLETVPTDLSLGGTWSKLPRSPFAALNPVALWVGDLMVTIDPDSGRTATYDPVMRRWEEHQPIPGASGDIPATVWTGKEVVLAGHNIGPDDLRGQVHLAFDPSTGRWRTLAPSPLTDTGSLSWTGELLVEVTRKRHAAAYDPAADCWLAMPDVPPPELRPDARTTPNSTWLVDSLAWTGQELLAVVRKPDPRRPFGVVAFDPVTWTWVPGPQAPSAIGPGGILVDGWLLFLGEGNDERSPTVGAYDPATGTWTVDESGCRPWGIFEVWTGRLILSPLTRRAYDPASEVCYRIPKLKGRTRHVHDVVWSGREYIVWSGAYGDADVAYRDGVAYRPPRKVITDEPARPIGKNLQRAIGARRSVGFDTDPDVVRAIRRDPYQPDSRQYGFPMTEAEAQDLLARSGWTGRAASIRPWLRKQEGFGGIWIDQRDGGAIAIAFTEAYDEVIHEIDQRFAPFDGPTPWKLVIVPRSYEELREAFRRAGRVSRAVDPDAMLWAVGLDESGGVISLVYDPGDVKRVRAKKQKLEKRLGVPVRITSGRVTDL